MERTPHRSPRASSDTVRVVATGWTGVDMSTPLLPETIPEIDADPASLFFFLGGEEEAWRVGVANVHVQQQPGCKCIFL